MSATDKISLKEIIAAIAILIVTVVAMGIGLVVFRAEGLQHSFLISDAGAKDPNHVQMLVKLLTIDVIKGDATARIEFAPSGELAEADGTLAHDLKFYINSANGKQEIDFAKGKRMTPVEAVLNMYEGNASEYPIDRHKAMVELYMTPGKAETKKAADKPAATTTDQSDVSDEPAAAGTKKEAVLPDEIPIEVEFFGSLPGYKISALVDSKETDASYVVFDVSFARSWSAIAFSLFITLLMWVLTISVLFLVISVLLRGRKVEIAMFSFMAALLFAFYTVRNSQPNVPPVGTFSDFVGFFWAEIIVGACLVIGVVTWVLRPIKQS